MLGNTGLSFMLLQLELLCQLNTKERRHPALIARTAPQQYVWIVRIPVMSIRDPDGKRSVFLGFRSSSERSDAGEIDCREK